MTLLLLFSSNSNKGVVKRSMKTSVRPISPICHIREDPFGSERIFPIRSVRLILSSISPSMIRISEISTVKMTGRTCTFVFRNTATFGRVLL